MQVSRELEVHECPVCFVTYAGPKRLFEAKRRNGTNFYCPNGHNLSYHDSEEDKLRRERDQLKQRIALKDDQIAEAIDRAMRAQKEVNKLTTRASHGVCPCCKRTFSQLARHMKQKHPEFKAVAVVK